MKVARSMAVLTLLGGIGLLSYTLLEWNRDNQQVLGVNSSRDVSSASSTSSAKTLSGVAVWDESLPPEIMVATDKFPLGEAITITTVKGKVSARVNKISDSLSGSVLLRVNSEMLQRLGGDKESASTLQVTVTN